MGGPAEPHEPRAESAGRPRDDDENFGFNDPAFDDDPEYTRRRAYQDGPGFNPDAGYTHGRPEITPDFIPGPPRFAAEVRSTTDYGPAADRDYAEKRSDYFAAGTVVVWDVDPQARTVRSYRADAPDTPTTFHDGDTADAEPALPGWRVAATDIFPPQAGT